MNTVYKLPLFPLHTVLFPGMVLPLHIFEPRYHLMINHCVSTNSPFGVVLIKDGHETSPDVQTHDIGTTALVSNIRRLNDDRMDIHTVGHRRFVIRKLHYDNPYLTGSVEDLPLRETKSDAVSALAEGLRQSLVRYLQTLAAITDKEFNSLTLPDDAIELAFITAIALPVPPEEKQNLLVIDELPGLLRAEMNVLKREWILLKHVQNSKGQTGLSIPLDDDPSAYPISPN